MTVAPPLVGRADELDVVCDAIEHSRGVVLSGTAGVGKTRLAADALEAASRHHAWHVVSVTAGPETAAVPFAPFLPLLGDDVSGDGLSRFLRASRELTARGPRVVVFVDDAHELDDVSVAFLRHLVAATPVRIVLTVRSGEPAPPGVTALWQGGPLRRIEVLALARRETEDLVPRLLGGPVDGLVLRWVWETTRGNALFIHELVADAQERGALVEREGRWVLDAEQAGAGARLQEIVEARLGSLAEDERAAVELVALGEPLSLSLLEGLVGGDAVARLEDRGLIAGHRDRRRAPVHLAHPLHGEVVRATMTMTAGRTRRRELIDATVAAGARRKLDAVRIAVWRCEIGDVGDWEAMLAAAEELASAGDRTLISAVHGGDGPELAPLLRHVEQAVRLARGAFDGGGSVSAAALLIRLLTVLGRDDEAAAVHEEAARLASDEADELALVRARAGVALFDRHDATSARSLVRAFGERAADPDVRVAASASLALMTALTGSPPEALRLAREVLESGGGTAGDRLLATAAAAVALGEAGRIPEALELVEAGFESLAADDLPELAVSLSLVRGVLLASAGQLDEAEELARSCYAAADEAGDGATMGTFATMAAHLALEHGHVGRAAALAAEAAERLADVDPYGVRRVALALRVHAAALAGSLDEAAAARGELDDSDPPEGQRSQEQRARAWLDVAAGRTSVAVARLEAAAETLAASGHLVREAAALHDLVRLGHAGTVEARLSRLVAACDTAVVATMAAQAAAAGDAAALQGVAERWSSMGYALFAAEAHAQAASVFDRDSLRSSAAAAGARAQDAAASCGPVSTPALSLTGPAAALTKREREIATLAARGLSDRQIADDLVVSVRTVQTHLYNSYAKLGIGSRGDLAAVLGAG